MDNLKDTQERADAFAVFSIAVNQYAKALSHTQLVASAECKDAYTWAKTAHPKWIGTLLHTKKIRAKKKYHNQITNEWREHYVGLRSHP